jgi:hypothetical protein
MQKPTECPCCGQTIAAMPPELLARVVSDRCAELVTILAKSAGTFVPCAQVVAWVYRHDPEGGPYNARTCINQVVSYNRPKLRAMGWDIEGRLGPYGGYRLVVSQDARNSNT